jgi:hypothetical protein
MWHSLLVEGTWMSVTSSSAILSLQAGEGTWI